MRKITLFLFFCISLFATNTPSVEDINATQNIKQNLIYATYEEQPKKVYVGQIFSIKVKLIIATKDFDKIKTKFINGTRYDTIETNSSWEEQNSIFYKTFYYKALSKDAKFPSLVISIVKNKKVLASYSLPPISTKVVELQKDMIFSGVIAKSLKVIKSKTTKFDDKSNIFVMEIKGDMANLKDFNITDVIKNGIDSYEMRLPDVKIYYFAIIPKTQKFFNFTYFNSTSNSFKKISIPIKLQKENISTQLELNPKESKLSLYKNIALIVVAIIFFIIYVFRRKSVYLVLVLIILIYLFLFYNPFDKITLTKGEKITILPTYNSTVFYVVENSLVAQKLNEIDGYIKVQLPNGKIGWIKKEHK